MANLLDLQGLTYWIKTFGCQMNLHESERVAGLLEAHGLLAVSEAAEADVCVFMSCCVRQKANTHLEGQVSAMASAPAPPSGRRTVALGGCVAQRDAARAKKSMPRLDVVFGTQALEQLPQLIAQSRAQKPGKLVFDTQEPYQSFSADLPQRRAQFWHAWVPIMYGCDNFCSYCVVPYVRGRERSRPFDEVLKECSSLVHQGVREICLLGQNVNSYGHHLKGAPPFSELLDAVASTGVERVRFTSSHPKDLDESTLNVMAKNPHIMPHLHLAAQSGSNAILKAMNRHYTKEAFLELAKKAHETVPGLALTTDLIVGFPGESDEDFAATLALVDEAQLAGAFTFIYSKRKGTKAAAMPHQIPSEIAHERLVRLAHVVRERSAHTLAALEGKTVEVLCEGASKRDPSLLTGHSPQNHTVHVELPPGASPHHFEGKLVLAAIETTRSFYVKGTLVGDPW